MNNNSTHVIRNFPSQDKSEMCRLSDGMIICYRSGYKIAFGENPNQLEWRQFMDATYAMAALRKIADEDYFQFLRTKDPDIQRDAVVARVEEVDSEPRIKRVQ